MLKWVLTMSEEVYVAKYFSSISRKRYHTDKDCKNIAKEYQVKDLEEVLERGAKKCKWCAGSVEYDQENRDRSLRRAIEAGEIDPDNFNSDIQIE